MTTPIRALAIVCVALGLAGTRVMPVQAAGGVTYYVATTGTDPGSCPVGGNTSATPFRTVAFALSCAAADGTTASTPDTIDIAAGPYYEHLVVDANVNLVGAGAASTTLDGSNTGTVVTVDSGYTVQMSGLTIEHGSATAGNGTGGSITGATATGDNGENGDDGGAAAQPQTVTTTCTTTDGADAGGGIVNHGNLTVSQSLITANSVTGGTGGTGGSVTGTYTVTGGNGGDGGPTTDVAGGKGGNASLSITCGAGTGGNGGGGVFNDGTLDVLDSAITDNSGTGGNGGKGGASNFTEKSTGGNGGNAGSLTGANGGTGGKASFTLNVLGGGRGGTAGAALYNSGTVTVTATTFASNTATGGSAGAEGSLTATLTASDGTTGTSTANATGGARGTADYSANFDAAGGSGGSATTGVDNAAGTLSISNSTLSGTSPSGGAILTTGGTVTVGGSILTDSAGGSCSGTITDGGYNLEWSNAGTVSSCGFSSTKHDLTTQDPKLGALGDNGGPTPTMALSPTSPAIDYIPTTVASLCASGGTDQRGYPRPDNGETVCDIGAYEFQNDTGPSTTTGGTVYLKSGSKLTDSATLSGGANPGGTITFYLFAPGVTPNGTDSNNVYSDTVTVTGDGTYTTSQGTNPGGYLPTGTGTYQWVAVYSGDSTNAGSSTAFGDEPETASKAPTTTTLTSSQNPSTSGQSVTFTATITVNPPGSGTPTGHVEFQDNGTDIQNCGNQTVSTTNNITTATCSTSSLSPGVHTITAIYSGDDTFAGSTGTLVQDVSTTVPNGKSAYDIESSNWYCSTGGTTCVPPTNTDASQCVTMTPCLGASYGTVEAFGPATNAASGVPDELILACVQGTASGYQIGYLDVLSHQGTLDYPGGVYGTADSGTISGKGTLIGGGGSEDNPSQPSSVNASAYDLMTSVRGSVTGIQNTDNTANRLNSGQFRVTITGKLWTVTNGQAPVRNTTSSTMSCTVGGSHATDLRDAGKDSMALAEGELEPSLGDNFFVPTFAPKSTSG